MPQMCYCAQYIVEWIAADPVFEHKKKHFHKTQNFIGINLALITHSESENNSRVFLVWILSQYVLPSSL